MTYQMVQSIYKVTSHCNNIRGDRDVKDDYMLAPTRETRVIIVLLQRWMLILYTAKV